MTELAKTYEPTAVEAEILDRWAETSAFDADPNAAGDPFCIVIPPPNVTAALHMGHALNNTLQDVLVRWRRMEGRNTLWMPGTDHAGIATQTVVEKRVLQEEGRRRTDFTREAFVAKIQTWKDEYEATITEQLRRMGCSCDWRRQRFTMDPVCVAAVREAFYRLFRDGLIYRGKRLVHWDPVTMTALADDEVEMEEIDGSFWYLRYPLETPVEHAGETIDSVVVATTRPETMLGDTAVAVNPRDPRAAALRGARVRLPIVGRLIPIVEDEYVVLPDPESTDEKARFSSGFLKVTPAHDPNDWEIGQRFDLPVINVMAEDASISRDHGWPEEEFDSGRAADAEALLGLSREDARAKIVEWFEREGLLVEVKPYRHSVGHSYRSHVPVEPYLSDQWYVKVTDERLAGAALRAIAEDQRAPSDGCTWKDGSSFASAGDAWEGGLRFHPARYGKVFQAWHENLRDWCISRQLWWGHRIPVWSAPAETEFDGSPFGDRLAEQLIGDSRYICVRSADDAAAIEAVESAGYCRDEDVLDTWFSSGLWPTSTMGWPNPEAFPSEFPEGARLLERWNPGSVLCTAREIITLWVSRMVMFNIYFRDCLPFSDVFIHAMIQDGEGQKMSKSLGNGVDPLDIIHSHGADAMRFTLASMSTDTQDVRMPVDTVCPHSGETFKPKMMTNKAGYRVAAPVQDSPGKKGKKMVTSYGIASGEAQASDDLPLARNTSSKFDFGRNFANKIWNAVRFALGNLESSGASSANAATDELGLADRWILSRLAAVIDDASGALGRYEFSSYAQHLYDFAWRDFCDWYIEAVKPTVRENATQRNVLAVSIDALLRLLHPVMPFITERLFERLNGVVPERGVAGLELHSSEDLVRARWPVAAAALRRESDETEFSAVRDYVTALREVRTTHKVPPREAVRFSARAPAAARDLLENHRALVQTLAGATVSAIGPDVERPANSAATTVGEVELYVHDLVDAEAEKERLERRLADLRKSVSTLGGRLANRSYVEKAPPHLVEQSKEQLEDAKKEAALVEQQLAAIGSE